MATRIRLCEYHDQEWEQLVEQGFHTARVEDRDGKRIAVMMRQDNERRGAPESTEIIFDKVIGR